MPTLNEVWEQATQINANLVTLHGDLLGLTARADETNDWLADLRQVTASGFTAVSAGITAVQQQQEATNALLYFLLQQQQAVICNLEKIAVNTCHLVNDAAQQTRFQEQMAAALAALEHMFASANAEAALSYVREQEQRARLDACCPKPALPVPCVDVPCESPRLPKHEVADRTPVFRAEPARVRRVTGERPAQPPIR